MSESANDAALAVDSDIDGTPRRALGANGCDDANVGQARGSADFDFQSLHAAARAHRMRLVGDLLAASLHAVTALVRGWLEQYRRTAEARATYRALAELDSRTLNDLGIHRSEMMFVAHRLAHGEAFDERRGLR